jgi:hypothetical protein
MVHVHLLPAHELANMLVQCAELAVPLLYDDSSVILLRWLVLILSDVAVERNEVACVDFAQTVEDDLVPDDVSLDVAES